MCELLQQRQMKSDEDLSSKMMAQHLSIQKDVQSLQTWKVKAEPLF